MSEAYAKVSFYSFKPFHEKFVRIVHVASKFWQDYVVGKFLQGFVCCNQNVARFCKWHESSVWNFHPKYLNFPSCPEKFHTWMYSTFKFYMQGQLVFSFSPEWHSIEGSRLSSSTIEFPSIMLRYVKINWLSIFVTWFLRQRINNYSYSNKPKAI